MELGEWGGREDLGEIGGGKQIGIYRVEKMQQRGHMHTCPVCVSFCSVSHQCLKNVFSSLTTCSYINQAKEYTFSMTWQSEPCLE